MSDRFTKRLGRNVQRPVGRDVDDEIAFHLEMRRRDLMSKGLDARDAAEEAERLFGDRRAIAAQSRRQTRAARRARERGWQMTRLLQDLRFALRKLAHEPGFAAAAVLTLALGIGANTAVFSVLDAVLLRPLGFPDSERLVALWEVNEEGVEIAVAHENFQDWKRQASGFESMALFGNWSGVTIAGEFDARTARGASVSSGFFDTLGIRPVSGRFLDETDHRLGADPIAVIGEGLWRSTFGAVPPSELSFRMGGELYQVAGVVPDGQEFPEGAEFWIAHEREEDHSSRTAHNYRVLARLPGEASQEAALETAQAEMSTIASRLAKEYEGEIDAVDVAVRPWHEEIVSGSKRPLWLLLGAAGLLLVVACANLSGSLLARSFSRRREMAVRAAIGAGQGGLMQQLLVESLLLATLGGLAGIALATLFVRALLALAPPNLPRLDAVGVDPRVLLFTFAVSTVAGVVLGLVPGWSLLRTPLRSALSGSALGGRRHRLWNLLVATEVALALVLLVGAGLLLGTVREIVRAPLGFDPEGILTADVELPVDLPEWGSDLTPLLQAEQRLGGFAQNLIDETAAIPGVERAALVSSLPPRGMPGTTVYLDDRPADEAAVAGYLMVSDDYFDILGVPLLEGRGFDRSDVTEGEHVAVISKAMAERYWPDSSALGQRIRPPGMDPHGETWLRVVGVVGDVRQRGATREAPPIMYVSLQQRPFRARWSSLLVEAESPAATAGLAGPLRDTAKGISRDMPLQVATLSDVLSSSISRQRFQMLLMTTFAGLGLLLAAGGIWAVVAFQVAERRTELGIRMALGAEPRRLVTQVLAGTLAVIGAGSLVGLIASFALSRSLAALLYGVEPNEPSILIAMAALLGLIGLLASLLPALRAARVNPSISLRAS